MYTKEKKSVGKEEIRAYLSKNYYDAAKKISKEFKYNLW